MQNEFIGHQSVVDRVLLENVSRETILLNPVTGTGIGTYVIYLHDNFSDRITNYWQYQPDHNSYLLITAELGIPGVILYLYLIYLIYVFSGNYAEFGVNSANCYKCELLMFRSVFIVLLTISLVDHYFWTSNQMRMLLWILFGMMVSSHTMKQNVSRETF
jgi:O-antigen ligase